MLLFTQEVSTPGVWRWKLGRCVHASLVDWKASQLSVVCNSATLNQISLSSSSCFFFLSFFLFFIWWPTGEKRTKFGLFYQSLLKEKKKKNLEVKIAFAPKCCCLFVWVGAHTQVSEESNRWKRRRPPPPHHHHHSRFWTQQQQSSRRQKTFFLLFFLYGVSCFFFFFSTRT